MHERAGRTTCRQSLVNGHPTHLFLHLCARCVRLCVSCLGRTSIAVIRGAADGYASVSGVALFTQPEDSDSGDATITLTVSGLPVGLYGFVRTHNGHRQHRAQRTTEARVDGRPLYGMLLLL